MNYHNAKPPSMPIELPPIAFILMPYPADGITARGELIFGNQEHLNVYEHFTKSKGYEPHSLAQVRYNYLYHPFFDPHQDIHAAMAIIYRLLEECDALVLCAGWRRALVNINIWNKAQTMDLDVLTFDTLRARQNEITINSTKREKLILS